MTKSMDFRVHVGFFSHPKTLRLKRVLGREGIYSLIRLWAEAAKNFTNGIIKDMDVIAELADWQHEPDKFVGTLSEIGFLDKLEDGWRIHDWDQHNPWVAGLEKRRQIARENAASGWEKRHKKKDAAAKQNDEPCNAKIENSHCEDRESAMLPSPPLPSSPLPSSPLLNLPKKASNAWAIWVEANRRAGRADPLPTGPELGAAKQLGRAVKPGEELAAIMLAYLQDDDKFIVNNGHSLTLLLRRIEKYRTGAAQQKYTAAGGVDIEV